jgi:hypothetical protein
MDQKIGKRRSRLLAETHFPEKDTDTFAGWKKTSNALDENRRQERPSFHPASVLKPVQHFAGHFGRDRGGFNGFLQTGETDTSALTNS